VLIDGIRGIKEISIMNPGRLNMNAPGAWNYRSKRQDDVCGQRVYCEGKGMNTICLFIK